MGKILKYCKIKSNNKITTYKYNNLQLPQLLTIQLLTPFTLGQANKTTAICNCWHSAYDSFPVSSQENSMGY